MNKKRWTALFLMTFVPFKSTVWAALNLHPTFNSIGVELTATTTNGTLEFKKSSDGVWRQGLPMYLTGGALYGSVVLLDPGTSYDVRITLQGGAVVQATLLTRAENIPPVNTLVPTHFVRVDGTDTNAGTANTPQGAWRTIGKALTSAPSGARVQVGPGFYQNGGSRSTPVTLYAQFPAVDDNKNEINRGQRSVIEGNSPRSRPAGSTAETGIVEAPWVQVTPDGDPAHPLWKWTGGASPWMGYAAGRLDQPKRLATWKSKSSDPIPSPAAWATMLYTNGSYRYGQMRFGSDIYVRITGDRNPNQLYMSGEGGTGFSISGDNIRISGFEIRPFSEDFNLNQAAHFAVIDHNIMYVGYTAIKINGVEPNTLGSDHVIEHNVIKDSSLWGYDHVNDPPISWNLIKGSRIAEDDETTAIFSEGGARRLVFRHNMVDGPFNGILGYSDGAYDDHATHEQDIHDNIFQNISDDTFEAEFAAINWRIWNNLVRDSCVGLSTDGIPNGSIYLFRNVFWNLNLEGQGRDVNGGAGGAATFFKYSGGTSNPPRVLIVHNTMWTNNRFQNGVEGAAQYAGGGSPSDRFYSRNNIIRSTREIFANIWDENYNSLSTSAGGRGIDVGGKLYTTDIAGYRTAYGRGTVTNVGWTPTSTGAHFNGTATIDGWLTNPAAGDLRLKAGVPFVDGGMIFPNISDLPGVNFKGTRPDLGATELSGGPVTTTPPAQPRNLRMR